MDAIINYSELRFVRAIGWNARDIRFCQRMRRRGGSQLSNDSPKCTTGRSENMRKAEN